LAAVAVVTAVAASAMVTDTVSDALLSPSGAVGDAPGGDASPFSRTLDIFSFFFSLFLSFRSLFSRHDG
jgi:hypothetical protein